MTKYALPDLPYDYAALEPHISAKIMQLHHDKHHKAYVDGANQTLDALGEAREKNDFARIAALEHNLAFHVSGHVLHSIFWQNLSPNGGGKPSLRRQPSVRRLSRGPEQGVARLASCAGDAKGNRPHGTG